MKEDNKIKI